MQKVTISRAYAVLPSIKVLNNYHHYIDQSDFSWRSFGDSAELWSLIVQFEAEMGLKALALTFFEGA